MKPTVSYVAALDGVSHTAVAAVIKSCGLSAAHVAEGEGVTFFLQKGQEALDNPNVRMFAVEDGIMLGLEMPPGSDVNVPVTKGEMSFGEALGKYGVYPMLSVAIDVLRTALSRCTNSYCEQGEEDPAEVQTMAAAIIADFGTYVAEIISLMPAKAIKFDNEIGVTPAMDLYETFLKSEYDPKPEEKPAGEAAAGGDKPAAEADAAPVQKTAEEIAAEAAAAKPADTNTPAADAAANTAAADAGGATVQKSDQEQAAQAAQGTDATALMKGFAEEMAKLMKPVTEQLSGLAQSVQSLGTNLDGVTARVEKAEKSIGSTVIGGHAPGDRVRKSDAPAASDNFSFDTGMGRPI